MNTVGRVIQINNIDNTATVAVARPSACGENCAMCKGCQLTTNTCVVNNESGAVVGDNVKIAIDTKTVLLAAFLVYGTPLLMFAIAYLCILAISENTTISVIGAIIAFFLSFTGVYFIDKKINKTNRIQSKIIKILN